MLFVELYFIINKPYDISRQSSYNWLCNNITSTDTPRFLCNNVWRNIRQKYDEILSEHFLGDWFIAQ